MARPVPAGIQPSLIVALAPMGILSKPERPDRMCDPTADESQRVHPVVDCSIV